MVALVAGVAKYDLVAALRIGLGAYDAFLNPGFIEGLVAREPYGIEQEQLTLSEQLDSIKKEIKEIPEKVKNIPKTIEEAVSDPKSFIEKRKRLSQNASEMSENQENEIEFAEQDYIDPYAEKIEQQRKAEQIAADRLKNAEESFSVLDSPTASSQLQKTHFPFQVSKGYISISFSTSS